MTDNRAVVERRKNPKGIDFFPTPPWATRALMRVIDAEDTPLVDLSALDPCAGRGHMVKPLAERFGTVTAGDVRLVAPDEWVGPPEARPTIATDFLLERYAGAEPLADWIVMNPPFVHAEGFIMTALARAEIGVAALTRLSFLETTGRYERVYRNVRPTMVLIFAERVPMLEGRCLRAASTATAYAWLLWDKRAARREVHNFRPTLIDWIGPCRDGLERWWDYDDDIGPWKEEQHARP